MSKISQFKIRKPKNSKTSQNVLFEKPTKICQKKNSLGFTMKWNSKKAHSKLTHINQHEKTNCQKKKKKHPTKKKAKIKNIDNQQQKSHPQFSQIEREREREEEREFLLYLCLFTGLLCFVSCVYNACALYCHYQFHSLFQKKKKKKHELRRSSVKKSVFFFCCCRDHPDFHPFFPPSFRPPPSLSHLGTTFLTPVWSPLSSSQLTPLDSPPLFLCSLSLSVSLSRTHSFACNNQATLHSPLSTRRCCFCCFVF
jgi:hypothetical protein